MRKGMERVEREREKKYRYQNYTITNYTYASDLTNVQQVASTQKLKLLSLSLYLSENEYTKLRYNDFILRIGEVYVVCVCI